MSAPRRDAPGRPRSPDAERVTEWKGFRLLDFQIQAIDALRSGQNVLVSAPTGAGKTLVAEYAIADAVRRGRRCVYTAPIKALSNQKYRDFRDDPTMDVGLMTGDVTIRPSAQVLIMTTEILRNSIFESPRSLDEVDFVIFDEVHFMDDPERGSVWEESLIFAPPDVRFIALSATVKNLDQLGAWIGEIRPQDLRVIHSERRPVPLRHRLYAAGPGLFTPERLEWARRHHGAHAGRRGRRRRAAPRGRGRDVRAPRDRADAAIAELFDELQAKERLPVLVFSFSRKDCERLARANQHRRLLSPDEQARMRVLQEELRELFKLEDERRPGDPFALASRGVGFHHAGMLPIDKEIVERMFTSGLMKMLFTTETFALGINMPARTVVFSSLRKFDGVNFDYLRTRDYLQMAGRAGRQGIDREGLVVSFLDERDLDEAPLGRMLSAKPEPIESRFRLSYSSLLHLIERLGRERLHEAWDKSFNRFQHRARSRKAREHNDVRQRALVDAHLALLEELGYLQEDRLTPRGRIARLLYGYELLITEMLFRGVLEPLPKAALAVVFVGLVHSERRPGGGPHVPARLFGNVRRQVDQLASRLHFEERRKGVPTPLKLPEWGLTAAVTRWVEGAELEELFDVADVTPGDLCRTFRMALQLVRQVRRTLDRRDAFGDRLDAVVEAMNRGEIDARRQLELG